MIIKLTEGTCQVRAEKARDTWAIEGRKDGLLAARFRVSGHLAHVDVFTQCETTLHGLVRDIPGEMQ